MSFAATAQVAPRTEALRRALSQVRDWSAAEDLMFLEAWELRPAPGAGPALRVAQIRRANPALAAEIRAELARGRPLTPTERESLVRRPPQPAQARRAS